MARRNFNALFVYTCALFFRRKLHARLLSADTVFLFGNRPLALCIFGLLIWLVQSGVLWRLGAALGWRPSASLQELAHRYALFHSWLIPSHARGICSNLPLFLVCDFDLILKQRRLSTVHFTTHSITQPVMPTHTKSCYIPNINVLSCYDFHLIRCFKNPHLILMRKQWKLLAVYFTALMDYQSHNLSCQLIINWYDTKYRSSILLCNFQTTGSYRPLQHSHELNQSHSLSCWLIFPFCCCRHMQDPKCCRASFYSALAPTPAVAIWPHAGYSWSCTSG